MEEVKKRTYVIYYFLNEHCKIPYQATNLESMCLQIRKILELIALGSLVANREEFAKQNEKFTHFWNARLILQDIERINPGFYPKPIKEDIGKKPGIKSNLVDLKTGFLTRKKFVKVYEKCGAMMHADNPYCSRTDFSYYDKSIPVWKTEIITLLNCHTISLLNDDNLYLIHMKGGRDDKVHGYTFAPV